MKISYNWLKQYIDINESIDNVSKILTSIGLEVEAIEKLESIKGGLEGVVVGEVLTCEKHPDADKLNITTVDYGQGAVQIVCGAPNVAAGLKVVVATVGCTLYPSPEEEFKIKRSKIRGVESLGMLCAEDELGLGVSHDGIMVLDNTVAVGTSAKELFNLQEDYLLEIGLTPNRIDAASHYGVARDLAVWLTYSGKVPNLQLPDVSAFKVANEKLSIPVEVLATEKAPRYLGLTISGVKVEASPQWLQTSLRAIGITPKNNVVDVTNYVLHEIGQPLHAFDADKIAGGKVVVRTANEGEKFVTLDSVDRVLTAEDLVICDSEKPMCIAGVMGGVNSGVSESTQNIFLESAYFNPVSIRKSAKRHGISSDASFRYERGTDPNIVNYALQRAALLIQELAGGEISSQVVEVSSAVYPKFEIELSIARTNRLIGKEIEKSAIISILKALEIDVIEQDSDILMLKVPQYRVDVQREADIVEEIMRIYGFDNIEIPSSVKSTISYSQTPDVDRVINRISNLLSSNCYHEIMSNSLTSSSYYDTSESFPLPKCVAIANPLSQDLNVMRQTLLFNALEAVELNTNQKNGNLKLYEFGNCYFYDADKVDEDALKSYSQRQTLGLMVVGNESSASWNSAQKESTIYTLKCALEKVFRSFGMSLERAIYEASQCDIFSDAMSVKIKNKQVLDFGVVSKSITKKFGIKATVYYAEINFDNFMQLLKGYSLAVEPLSKYPLVKRDLAMLVDKNVSFIDIYNVAVKTEKKMLKSVSLFDVYEGDKLPEGKKSYALNFVLEDTTKTLTDNVIDKCMNNLMLQFEKQLNVQIRK